MLHAEFKTRAPIKTSHISIMNLNFCLLFFMLLTSCCFTSALLCYKCGNKNTDFKYCLTSMDCKYVMKSEPYKSNGETSCNWEIIQCSGSCFYEWKDFRNSFGTVKRSVTRFVNPVYFWQKSFVNTI